MMGVSNYDLIMTYHNNLYNHYCPYGMMGVSNSDLIMTYHNNLCNRYCSYDNFYEA